MEDVDIEVQVRAFKKMKVSKSAKSRTRDSHHQAANNMFGRRGRAITRPHDDLFGSRTRHTSCPERVETSSADAHDSETLSTVANKSQMRSRPLSPPTLHATTGPLGNSVERLQTDTSTHDSSECDVASRQDESGETRSRGLKRSTTCSDEARIDTTTTDVNDMSVDELAGYFDAQVHIPRKMSFMAELMYT